MEGITGRSLRGLGDSTSHGLGGERAVAPRREFDLQAHRGGLGLRVENTLASFGNALQLGVSTLELDVQITEDGQAVVTHDRRVSGAKCADTAPATAGRPGVPVRRQVRQHAHPRPGPHPGLRLARRCPTTPGQLAVPGARMPLLSEVFALVKRYRADDVKLNIETKVEAGAPSETAPREQFVQVDRRGRSAPPGCCGRSPSRASTGAR